MSDQAMVRYVSMRLKRWQEGRNTGAVRAELAQLRHCIGTIPGERPEIWNLLFDGLPEEMMSRNGKPTREEWAIFIALTMYALHQQGSDHSMHLAGERFGMAVRKLATSDDELEAIRRRFNTVITASDMRECAYYLRGLIQLLRSKNIPLDYARLAQDIYWIQTEDGARSTKLIWGQDFYRMIERKNEEDTDHE